MDANKKIGLREKLLKRKLRQISKEYPQKYPSFLDLLLLHVLWGNIGFMASVRYLREIAHMTHRVDGAILECGSGLTTLLMGVLTKEKGNRIYSLEHHPEWQIRMQGILDYFGLSHVILVKSPLKDFGDYDWYNVNKAILPKDFDLVICDGPPGNIKGSRYGLLPEMKAYLNENCTILLDDAGRKQERAAMESWKHQHGFHFELCGGFQKYALIQRM